MSEIQKVVAAIDPSLVRIGVVAASCEELVAAMGTVLLEKGFVKPSYVQALLEREREFPTGIAAAGVGVAIPHSDASHVLQTTTAVWVLKEPVPFHVMGGAEEDIISVGIVFMLAINNPQDHLAFLQRLLGIFSSEAIMSGIRRAGDPVIVAEIINQAI